VRLLVAIFALVLVAVSPAYAEKRVALVIGNKDYKASVGPLTNPLNDIRLVSNALKSVGFEVLEPVENGTREEILRRIYEFASVLKDAGPDAVGFLYYSGHGVASAGENYLIPVDITEPSTEQLRVQGVKQSEVLAILRDEAPNAAHYLVLDACRNNLQGARGGKGFVPVGQQNGVLVAFSTEPGKTALDTGAASGPYAAALAAELTNPGQNDLLMFHNIRVDVMDKTNGDQVPWTEDGIERRERPVFAHAPPDQDKLTTASEAERAWSAIKDTKTSAVVEIFLRRYPDGFYADLARQKLAEIKVPNDLAQQENSLKAAQAGASSAPSKKTQVAVVAPPVAPAPGVSSDPCRNWLVPVSLSCPLSSEAERALKSKDVFRECGECPEMVVVPSGSFTMGAPSDMKGLEHEVPQHQVTIPSAFAVGKFTVTLDQFSGFVKETGYDAGTKCWTYEDGKFEERSNRSFRNPGFPQAGSHPAVCLNWNDAKAYAQWLSKKTGKAYRLLTEAEWEYAARAGTSTRYSWGDEIGSGNANCDGCGSQWDRKQTAPVGSFKPNAFELYDMQGNASQWLEDCWHEDYKRAPVAGSAWTNGDCRYRDLRGGSWNNDPTLLRADNRGLGTTDDRIGYRGFRVARTLAP
jgi:formylglycine-generating enzyme required for sulfatase activity